MNLQTNFWTLDPPPGPGLILPDNTPKMLPTGASSSIQKRRQHHRRQQSLEVPILATPLPPNPRRNNTEHRPSHRRGLSLDQSLSAMQSPTGFRPLLPQDHAHAPIPGPPSARTQMTTNLGQPPLDQQQHFIKQEPQEHSLAQPGFQLQAPPPQAAPNFQSHLHQQLNGMFNSSVSTSTPDQAIAMQQLQSHMMWYEQNFGNGTSDPNMQQEPFSSVSQHMAGDMAAPVFLSQTQPQPPVVPGTPVSQRQSHTVPNTPQNYVRNWPSPPPSHAKHQRSQSYQLDVAPMPPNQDSGQFAPQSAIFSDGPYGFSGEQGYAASAYSSSIADPSSPHQHSTPLPTLFEEPQAQYGDHDQSDILLQAAAGVEQDFSSPGFLMNSQEMCAEQAALDAAGIDATYIDTGITEEQINSWLEHPVGKGIAYRCKWEGCNTRINRKENARSHVQNHLDDRRFRCNPCGKRFNRLHDTKRHHLTHTSERPAVCPCGKTFARADALTRHRQRDMCEGVLPGFEKAEDEKPKRGRPKKDRSGENGDKSKRSKRPDMETRTRKAAMARAIDAANGHRKTTAASLSSAASDRSMPDTPPHENDALDTADFLSMNSATGQYTRASNSWLDTPPTSPASATPTKTVNSKMFIDLSGPEEELHGVSPTKLSTRSSPGAAGAASSAHDGSSSAGDASTLFADYSSPAGYNGASGFTGDSTPMEGGFDIFNGTVDFDVLNSHPQACEDIFSPPGESCSGSSVYNSDWDTVQVKSIVKPNLRNKQTPASFYGEGFEQVSRGPFNIDDFLNEMGSVGEEEQYGQVRDLLDSWVASH